MLVGLWLPAIINLTGVKNMGAVQVGTTILKFAAVLFMATVGLFFIHTANYTPWNVSGEGAIGAIGGGMAIALFSYLGVETASVAAGKVKDPDRNIPRSTVLGTVATAVVYMLSLDAVFGILSNDATADSTAPFSDAANVMFGGAWAGDVMSIAVIVSGLGALVGWTMICAEMPLAAAKDGLFPERFKRCQARRAGVRDHRVDRARVDRDGRQLPRLQRRDGVHDAGADDRHHCRHPVRVLGAGADQVALVDHKQGQRFARDMVVAVLSLVFSMLFIWYSRNTGHSFFVYWAPFLMAGGALLLGIPVYLRSGKDDRARAGAGIPLRRKLTSLVFAPILLIMGRVVTVVLRRHME